MKKQIFDNQLASKRCFTCKETKPASEFHKSKRTKDGLYTYCNDCSKIRVRAWYRNNREMAKTHKGRGIGASIKQKLKKYGLIPSDYSRMLSGQNGVCAICLNPETIIDPRTGVTRALAVDHCHSTGHIRGLLCHRCNRVLGLIRDSKFLCDSMKSYLSYEKTDI